MSNPKDGQRKWHVAAVIVIGLLSLLAAPSPATANSYHDFLCEIPYGPHAGSAAPTDDVTYSNVGAYSQGGSNCAAPNGEMKTRMDGEVEHPANGSGEYATFTVPGGLSIAGFTLWHYEQIGDTAAYGPPVATIDYGNGNGFTPIEFCDGEGGCSAVTPSTHLANANELSRSSLSGMTYIQWSAVCGDTGGTCPKGPNTEEDVYAADIDLVDDTPPSVNGVSGPLVAAGTLSGPQAISFTASDGQSGVYGGSLVVDGHTAVSQVLDTNGGACESLNVTTDGQRSFEHAQPCKSSLSAGLTLNTNLLAAGEHSLELVVEDAAGNRTIAYNGTITTSGPPQVGVNGSLTGRGPHIANGDPCAGEALELAVNGKRKPPIVLYGEPVTVRGVLHCGTVPIRGARVAIATLGGPASAAISTSVQTALDGSFSFKVPTGPDRQLRFSYTAYSNDPVPSATATATIMVSPRITLRIKPHHVRNRHTIYWTGTIAGGPYPRQGVTLDVGVQEGRHWKIFDQVVANRKGRFRYSYRFHLTEEPITYTFRVALPDTGAQGYPYTHGASNPVKVDVSPMVVICLLVCVCLMCAPAARAGEWAQVTCTQPDGLPAPRRLGVGQRGWTWQRPERHVRIGRRADGVRWLERRRNAYAGPMWTYTAPAGSTIAGGALTVSLLTPQGQAYVATPQNSYTSAADVLVNCQYNTPPCGSSGTGVTTVPIKHPGGTQLFMAAFCVAPTEGAHKCPAGSGGGVTLRSACMPPRWSWPTARHPFGTGFAGSLLAPNTSGIAELTFNAKDPEGPGVYRVMVDVDGGRHLYRARLNPTAAGARASASISAASSSSTPNPASAKWRSTFPSTQPSFQRVPSAQGHRAGRRG